MWNLESLNAFLNYEVLCFDCSNLMVDSLHVKHFNWSLVILSPTFLQIKSIILDMDFEFD